MKKNIYKIIFLILLTFYSDKLLAQNSATELIKDDLIVNSISITNAEIDLDVRKPTATNPLREKIVSAHLFVGLDMGEDYVKILDAEFDVELAYQVWMYDGGGNIVGGNWISQGVLKINELQPERLHRIDFKNELLNNSNFTQLKIKIQGGPNVTSGAGNPTGFSTFLNTNLRLAAKSKVTFEVDVRDEANQLIVNSPIIISKNTTTQNNRVQIFSWTSNYDFPNYELQILRLYNNHVSHENNLDEIKTTIDWSRALRVETQSSNTNFTLTIGEGTGFYLWRVRPVGNFFEGGIANSENYGKWSTSVNDGDVLLLNKNSISYPEAFYFVDPDENLNWIYNRVFTEGDELANGTRTRTRTSEGISYADGLLNLRQNQVYNDAQNSILISQTINDYSGRPAWSSLPVPVSGDMNLGYRVDFVQNDDGNLYTTADFDSIDIFNPSIIEQNGTDFQYYSDNNSDIRIPDAEGYAYKRTIFKNDGTGRVAEESGVGKVHALGTQTNGRGRTTRILYGSPSDKELIMMFGEEAPLKETVTKTITIDPNNVASVTYTSAINGNVIATALATLQTDNLVALNNTGGNNRTVTETVDHNFLQHKQFVSYKRLALPYDADVTFSYFLDCNNSGWGCLGGDCEYDIQFTVTDISNQFLYESNRISAICGNVDLSQLVWSALTSGAPPLSWSNSTLTLQEGEYLISKSLMDKLPINFIEQTTDDAFEETQIIIDVIANLMQSVDNADDYQNYADTMVLLQGYFASGDDANIISILDLPSNFNVPSDFTFDFTPNSGSNDPAQLTFKPSCCPSSSISITKPEICVACIYIDNVRQSNIGNPQIIADAIRDTVAKYFMAEVLDSHLVAQNLSLSYFDTIAPGFTKESMNHMLTEMLAAQYYTGNSKDTLGNWYKAEHNQYGDLITATPLTLVSDNNEFNYKCEKLFDCWRMAVGTIGNYSGGESTNLMDEFNDRQGDDSSEDHYDDEDAADKSSLGDKILGFIISIKMRKFNNSDEGIIQPGRINAIVSLPAIFMECAGYQFEAIIDSPSEVTRYSAYKPYQGTPLPSLNYNPNSPVNDYDLNAGLQALNLDLAIHGNYAPGMTEYDEDDEVFKLIEPYRLHYQYITIPELMYRFFIYNTSNDNYLSDIVNDNDDFNNLLPNHLDIEINSCYNPPNCSFNDGVNHTGHNLCFNPCRYYHQSWNSGQRLNFYNMIKNAPVDLELKSTLDSIFMDDTGGDEMPTCEPFDSLVVQANEQLDLIESNLPSRVLLFKSRIQQMLVDSCYEIVDCLPSAGQVSNQQIDLMVEAVINEIKNKIQLVRDNVGEPFAGIIYPNCSEEICHWVKSDYSCEERQELNVTYFAPCDQLILDQIQYWDFLPYGIVSQCISPGQGIDLVGKQYDGSTCDEEKDYSETYNVTNASLSGGN